MTDDERKTLLADLRKTSLLTKLAELLREQNDGLRDSEVIHMDADYALLAYIGYADVSAAFERLRRWYA